MEQATCRAEPRSQAREPLPRLFRDKSRGDRLEQVPAVHGASRQNSQHHTAVTPLPEAFSVGQSESIVREGLRRISRLWLKINGLGSSAPAGVAMPFLLSGGYALASLDADRDALREAYRALSDAEVDAAIARGQRNKLQDIIYAKLKAYRQKLAGYEKEYPELFTTLPALSPAAGHTPDAVPVQAVWDAATTQARITWDASTDAALQTYEVRGSAGDSYDTDDEIVIATIPGGGPREAQTAFALNVPGLTAGFKVYVILNTGNERGSEPMYVVRPLGESE